MKYFFNFVLLLLLVTHSPAQQLKDELKTLVENTQDPVHKITLINRLNQKLLFIQDPHLIHYAKEALHLADELDLEVPQIEASSHLGMLYLYQGLYVEALKFLLKAWNIAEKLSDEKLIAQANLQLGHLLIKIKQYDKAEEHLEKARLAAQNISDQNLKSQTQLLWAELYFLKGEIATSQIKVLESLKTTQIVLDSTLRLRIHLMLSKIYQHKDQLNKAEQEWKVATKFLLNQPSPYIEGQLFLHQGHLLYRQNKFNSATRVFEKALSLSQKIPARAINLELYLALAHCYEQLNQLPKAIHFLRLHEQTLDSLQGPSQIVQLSQIMKNYDFNPRSYREAIKASGIQGLRNQYKSISFFRPLLFILIGLLAFFVVLLGVRIYYLQKSRHQLILENQAFSLDVERAQYEKEKLAALKREQDNRIKNVAHDLKAPLNRVYGLTELIHMDAENLLAEQVKYLNLISQVSFDAQIMVQNWLDTKKIEEQQLSIQLSKIDLNELLRNLIVGYKQQAAKKSIQLHFDNQNDQPFYLVSDINLIARILDNLLSNAIKFTPFCKNIYIDILEKGEYAQIAVRDEGIGISQADQKRLFMKFQKLSARPTGGESSTGLGLSIVKNLTEKLKGQIFVESQVGQGSTFTLFLPRHSHDSQGEH